LVVPALLVQDNGLQSSHGRSWCDVGL